MRAIVFIVARDTQILSIRFPRAVTAESHELKRSDTASAACGACTASLLNSRRDEEIPPGSGYLIHRSDMYTG